MRNRFAFLTLLLLIAGAAHAADSFLLRPDRVFDGSVVHQGWVVVVTGDTIAAAGPAPDVRAPEGATTINLAGATLMPGLIDAHSHIFLHPYNETLWNDQVLKE